MVEHTWKAGLYGRLPGKKQGRVLGPTLLEASQGQSCEHKLCLNLPSRWGTIKRWRNGDVKSRIRLKTGRLATTEQDTHTRHIKGGDRQEAPCPKS